MSTPQRPHRNRARVRRDGALQRVSQATRVVVIAAVSGAVGVGVYISRAIPGISAARASTSTGTTGTSGTSGTGTVSPATSAPSTGSTGGGVSAGSVGGSSSGGAVGGGSVGSASSAGNSYSGGSVGYVPAYQAPVASSGAS